MKQYVIIVAGGKGLRMGAQLPKQFLVVAGKPILMHTINVFHSYNPQLKIILVLPGNLCEYWHRLCREYQFLIRHTVVEGGETRFHSVKNGLSQIDDSGYVGVHDGVRPLVSLQVIARCYELAKTKKAVVPVVDVVETMRHVEGVHSVTVDRDAYKLVQTPQVFDTQLLQEAYQQPYSLHFTDDASAVEALGVPVTLTDGNRENIKITTPFDLKIAETLLGSCSI